MALFAQQWRQKCWQSKAARLPGRMVGFDLINRFNAPEEGQREETVLKGLKEY